MPFQHVYGHLAATNVSPKYCLPSRNHQSVAPTSVFTNGLALTNVAKLLHYSTITFINIVLLYNSLDLNSVLIDCNLNDN